MWSSCKKGLVTDDYIYMVMNVHWEMRGFQLPQLSLGMARYVFANTDLQPSEDIWELQTK